MDELGKIEKPSVESFSEKRKLYCIPNIYLYKDAPDNYRELVDRYWNEVTHQIENLEAAGRVKKIFYESIFAQGNEALEVIEKINEKALQIVRKRVEEGAVFLPIEREDIFGPLIDWANCLNVIRTKEVIERVYGFYNELYEKRIQHIQNVIESNLSGSEAGMLIMRDEDRVRLQFSKDIEVFLVTPPSYDDIIRWFREKSKEANKG